MSKEHNDKPNDEPNDEPKDRGALPPPPEPVAQDGFALLISDRMEWKVSHFAGGYRLDFRSETAWARARRRREEEER